MFSSCMNLLYFWLLFWVQLLAYFVGKIMFLSQHHEVVANILPIFPTLKTGSQCILPCLCNWLHVCDLVKHRWQNWWCMCYLKKIIKRNWKQGYICNTLGTKNFLYNGVFSLLNARIWVLVLLHASLFFGQVEHCQIT